MILGIPYAIWLGVLGAILFVLYMSPTKKKTVEEEQSVSEYIESLNELTEMRWVRARVTPKEVPELLDKIEVAKITVMYQFFVREGKYDMFFRCRKSQLEELKKTLELE